MVAAWSQLVYQVVVVKVRYFVPLAIFFLKLEAGLLRRCVNDWLGVNSEKVWPRQGLCSL